ncbi:hypothetical protein [Cohnella boryungensis]|uniref:hypothetical protein n=1 Tax=Cohnella boryungensis TaxID=768479 RepID=UPI0019585862
MVLNRKLVAKSGVGRALFDTSKQDFPFTLEPCERGWRLRIGKVDMDMATELNALVQEIHFFYYEDDPERDEHRKWWLSDVGCPQLSYEPDNAALTIEVSERVGFTVDSTEHRIQ